MNTDIKAKIKAGIKRVNKALCMFFAAILVILAGAVSIKAAPPAQAVIPIELSVTDNKGGGTEGFEGEHFTVMLTGNDKDTPMPSGSEESVYYKSMIPGTEEIIVAFAEPGDYRYRISAVEKEGFTGASVYDVVVRIAPDGYAQVAAYNEAGVKCEINFDLVGAKGQPDAPSSHDIVKDFVDVTKPSEVKEPEKPDVTKKDDGTKDNKSTETPDKSKNTEMRPDSEKNENDFISGSSGAEIKEPYRASVKEDRDAPDTGDDSISVYYFIAGAAGLLMIAAIYKLLRNKSGRNV